MADEWYYGQDGTQHGPVTLAALHDLARSGVLRPTDLVWTEGMAQWTAASTALPELFAPPAPPAPSAPMPPPAPTTVSMPPQPTTSADPLSYQAPMYDPNPQNARAITSLILGILSVPGCICPVIGPGMGIAAIILGVGVRPGPSKGIAIAGVVCGALGALFGVLQFANVMLNI